MKLTIGLLYFLQTLTYIQGEYNFIYLGCFKEVKSQRALMNKPDHFQKSENTIEYCGTACGQDGFRYAGLQYGRLCWCGNTEYYDIHGSEDAICDYECFGNSNQICGGDWANSMYEIVQVTPTKPTNATSTATSTTPATLSITFLLSGEDRKGESNFTYLGCFKDGLSRALENAPGKVEIGKNTIEYCVTLCGQEGYRYAGLQYGEVCLCGNSGYDRYGSEGAVCENKCMGNSSQICGGRWSTSVYEIVEHRPEDAGNDRIYIGIGVGAAVVCAIIVLVVVLVVHRRKKNTKNQSRTDRSTTDSPHELESDSADSPIDEVPPRHQTSPPLPAM